jgi:hypothetical protein
MADLTYAIQLDEDEITLLIQLLNERLVELEREHPSSPDTPVRPQAALPSKTSFSSAGCAGGSQGVGKIA